MIKIIKTIALAIKKGDIFFDLDPKTNGDESACFEVIKVNSLDNTLILKALNQTCYIHYIPNINTKLFIFDVSNFDKELYKLEIEV